MTKLVSIRILTRQLPQLSHLAKVRKIQNLLLIFPDAVVGKYNYKAQVLLQQKNRKILNKTTPAKQDQAI